MWLTMSSHLWVRTCELWQNGWLDQYAVWGGEWCRAWYGCIRFWWWSSKGTGSYGVNYRRPIVSYWELLRRSVRVRRAIELSFGMVSGMGPGIHVLHGGPRASRGKGCFWHGFRHFSKIQVYSLQCRHGVLIDDRLVCENWQYFPTQNASFFMI